VSVVSAVSVSIIICTCNRAEDLRQTLEAIGRLPVPTDFPCELIVVDNASTDGTATLVQSLTLPNMPLRYLLEPRRGKGYAYNSGMAAAVGDILLFTDDDLRPPPNWIAGMCEPIQSGRADAVAGGIKLAAHLHRPWLKKEHARWLASTEYLLPIDLPINLVGANMAFSKRVLEKVPQFDPELGPGASGLGDETLFSQQLTQAGYRIAMAQDVVAEHHLQADRLTRRSFAALARKLGVSNAYISWHWAYDGPRFPILALVRAWAALWARRLLHFPEWITSPTVPVWELQSLDTLYTKLHYLQEQKRPRNYEKFGLVKLR
jgi:glycosyltransferase involved in cell wall biosynthesis